ncbi:hypothetical protein [Pseudomonas savastanoi]|uniref:Uncharacterized protein n=2 Tax=Pseudomonas savastanoi TaxID=29438 RepID=A0ABC8BAZ3_PSESS|nr:hypothetical protein [Pseudomonas savastanoi]ARD11373.1 hypothetical protein PSA3335_10030 [Pseudomonas savastanoi pv. savastanoi NCPPB 3335]MBA4702929.1 hypothetical protein [Pseudomonas savastanoi pv. savastanoi]
MNDQSKPMYCRRCQSHGPQDPKDFNFDWITCFKCAAAPQPPALGGEPEAFGYWLHPEGKVDVGIFDRGIDQWTRENCAVIELIDRAHLAPLQAENAQLRILSADQALNLKRVKRDYVELKAELGQLKARCDELEALLPKYQRGSTVNRPGFLGDSNL